MRISRREFLRYAGAASALLGFSGCIAPPATPAPKKPIRIGASLSLTGAYARTGQDQRNGYELWRRDVNEKGGLLGRQVEFVFYDDESKPETGAKLYEKLITEDKVDLVLGPYSSPVTFAASTVTEKYKYPMVATGSAATNIWERGYKYIFQVYTPDDFYMDGAVIFGAEKGAKTMAIVNENTVFAKGAARGASKRAKEAGIEVVFTEEYTRGAPDFSPLLSKIKALNPDILLGGTYLPDSVLITRQAKELDVNPKMFAFSVGPALQDFYNSLGKDAEYVFGASQWEPSLKLPGVKEFVERYKAAFGAEPGYHAAGGYGGAQILEEAVKRVGSIDPEKMRETLAAMETTTIFGKYKVNEKGLQVAKPSYMTQWQEGKREIVYPKEAATAAARYPTPTWKERK